MSEIKKIQEDILTLHELGDLMTTYQEIAAIRMRKVKKYVLQNREFLSGLSKLYKRVHISYYEANEFEKQRLNRYMGKKEGNVSVLLASNTGLYGDIVEKTFWLFADNIRNTDTEVVIIGKIGKALYDGVGIKKEYRFFEFPDSGVDDTKLKKILEYITTFTNIIVYHGLFRTVLIQDPKKTFLTGDALAIQQEIETKEKEEERIKVLFEPSMEELVKFFETQIIGTVFEHIIYESSLSKFASRMVSLERAAGNIEDEIGKQKFVLIKEKHRENDSKQRDILSSAKMWS
ncbi:F0F1 ATP synthase subunit gamma [Patescibacteria group bacterium]|nr:F0F1 ATP synthase subunit gamma [Patescibacteria group bacterium]